MGNSEQKLFSLHTYGKFFYNMTPKNHDSIFEQLQKTKLSITLENGEEKLYYNQHIQTPDEFFTKIMDLTMLKHLDIYISNAEKKTSIKKLQRMLAQMLKKYPTLTIHIDFLRALEISLSYEEEVDKNLNILSLAWDSWYLKQIANYAPYLLQRPYYNKEKSISSLNQIYAYHLFTCLLYTSPSPRDATLSRMPSSA